MGSRGLKEVTIHITGFKKFRGVAENPTETIVNNLMSFVQSKRLLPPGVTLGSCTVLETAGDGALAELYKVLESGTSGNGNKKKHVIWFLKTTCSVDAILKFLKKKGYDATISNDAGLSVCNYVYYRSLRFAEQKGHKSLFVYVPLFTRIDEETQMQFVATLLEAIASTC
ncbi:hypothetical protein V6N13_102352 [Hibiscus sabdariffa]|uniref:Pyrrolidone-carboxylate peptidase n=1 Tax=Hibiscus sabdariffa TaxID=183260 RepID=A0ABR2D4M1_9ROSI